jgi:hypothetical protein
VIWEQILEVVATALVELAEAEGIGNSRARTGTRTTIHTLGQTADHVAEVGQVCLQLVSVTATTVAATAAARIGPALEERRIATLIADRR